jgi:hypothetical protein
VTAATPNHPTASEALVSLSVFWVQLCACALAAILIASCAERLRQSSLSARSARARASAWRGSAGASISPHEVSSTVVAGAIALTLVLGSVVTGVEDDVLDSASLLVLTLVLMALGAALTSLGALLAYSATPVGSGSVWRKLVFDDAVNFALYALRVALCWTRYIFYDLQVEGVDIALQQSDALFDSAADLARTPLEALL